MTVDREQNLILVDSHAHIHFDDYAQDRDDVVERAGAAGVTSMLLVGIDPADSRRALEVSRQYPGCYAAIGIHPQLAGTYAPDELDGLAELATDPRVVAVGETGFDLLRTPLSEGVQRALFEAHIQLAQRLELPLIIHDRQAHDETIHVLDERDGWKTRGVFHCFSGDVSLARKVLDCGFFVSVTGVVTFKNAPMLRDVVAFCPLDRLLVETDAPYLAPMPYRGKRNEPAFVKETAAAIARIKGVSLEVVAESTTENFRNLFTRREVQPIN